MIDARLRPSPSRIFKVTSVIGPPTSGICDHKECYEYFSERGTLGLELQLLDETERDGSRCFGT